jgi:hypothetical protein
MPLRASIVLAALTIAGAAASATTVKTDPSPEEIQKIIQKFAENETAFAKARENYVYRRTAKIQEYDAAGTPYGKFERVDEIEFTPGGRRIERAVRAPVPTLRLIQMTAEDEADLRDVMPFVMTTTEVDDYHIRYLGRQMADEIPAYVFAVKPKKMEPGRRYFSGQIWVDDRDLMIVKTYGRGLGIQKKGYHQQFPKFETYRQPIDGQFWFPVYTAANSTLYFPESTVQVKQTVKYDNYKQYKADSKITFGEEVTEPPKEPPKPQQ